MRQLLFKNKLSKKKKNGFTLVELLAVITILSIISVIVVFAATNIINKTKENSYQVSINNIELEAGNYVTENSRSIIWQDISNTTKQYSCIQVKHLIEMGYFDNDVLTSNVSDGVTVKKENYIYIEMDSKNKKIEKKVLLYDGSNYVDVYGGLCANINSSGLININVSPKGWQKEKDADIKYKVFESNNDVNKHDYVYSYSYFDNDGNEIVSEVDKKFSNNYTEELVINSNGLINASIKEIIIDKDTGIEISRNTLTTASLNISNIDVTKPSIVLQFDNGDSYKKSNNAVVKFKDEDSGFKIGKYKIYYDWSLEELTCEEIKSKNQSVIVSVDVENAKYSTEEEIIVNDRSGTGKIYVCSEELVDYVGNSNTSVISENMYLDNDRPVVVLGSYNETDEASEVVTLNLKVTDETSKIKSFTKEKIDVIVGGTKVDNISLDKIDNNGNYKLTINNKSLNGKVEVVVNENAALDEADNGNVLVALSPDISFKNIYKINYDANGGSGEISATECVYGGSCKVANSTFSYDYHTIKDVEWNTASDGSGTSYEAGYEFSNYNNDSDITLYAQWRDNKVNIHYNVNGGNIATASNDNGNWSSDSSGLVLNENKVYPSVVVYGKKLSSPGLTDYNNSAWVNISKTGYMGKTGEEWKCLSGCTTNGKTYNQKNIYSSSDFCDPKMGDCTVVLGVNWVTKILTVTFDKNDGSNTVTTQTFTYGVSGQKFASGFTRDCYKKLGWSKSSTATTSDYDWEQSVTDSWIDEYYPSVKLYAVWNPTKIPEFTYTGTYQILNDNDEVITDTNACIENWKIKFLTSGTLTLKKLNSALDGIDIFIVGGGGKGGHGSDYYAQTNRGGSGGGGGAGITVIDFPAALDKKYSIVIGAGATGSTASENSSFGLNNTAYYTALGGSNGTKLTYSSSAWLPNISVSGGSGRLGGETGNYGALNVISNSGAYGGNGNTFSSGDNGIVEFKGSSVVGKLYYGAGGGSGGQGDSTGCPGCSATNEGYSGGVNGGGVGGKGCTVIGRSVACPTEETNISSLPSWKYCNGAVGGNGVANTGSGGGGGGAACGSGNNSYGRNKDGGNGGSGVVIIRNTR